MKKIIKQVMLIVLGISLMGCFSPTGPDNTEEPEICYVQFSFKAPEAKTKSIGPAAKSTLNDAQSLVISITDDQGNPILTSKKLNLVKMGGQFVSEQVALPVGNYNLTEYMVLDADDNAIFVTPQEGADTSYLVNSALPIQFGVSQDQITLVQPEVLDTETATPAEFGYYSFEISVSETFDFLVSVSVYDDNSSSYVLSTADINVTFEGSEVYSGALTAGTNQITLNDYNGTYVVVIKKDGFVDFNESYTTDEMKNFFSMPLLVTMSNDIYTISLNIGEYSFFGSTEAVKTNVTPGTQYADKLVAGDFDGNGIDDIAFCANYNYSVIIWYGQGDKKFHIVQQDTPGFSFEQVFAGDFNGDGKSDLYFTDRNDPDSLWFGQSDKTVVKDNSTFDINSNIAEFTTGDFDGDGYSDIYVRDGTTGTIYRGGSDANMSSTIVMNEFEGECQPHGGDFNGDGYDDILWLDLDANSEFMNDFIWFNNGDATFASSAGLVGDYVNKQTIADVNNDGSEDYLFGKEGQAAVSVIYGKSDNAITRTDNVYDTEYKRFTAGDFDGDGLVDLFISVPYDPM